MKNKELTDQLNECETKRNNLNHRIHVLDVRLSKFKPKEERAARIMRKCLFQSFMYFTLSICSTFSVNPLFITFAVFTFGLSTFYLGVTMFQYHAYKIFKRFNTHSLKRYNKVLDEKNEIILLEQEIIKQINEFENSTQNQILNIEEQTQAKSTEVVL